MASRLQVILATPGLDAVRVVLGKLRHGDQLYLTAFSGSRVSALRELDNDDPSREVVEFGQFVGHCLSHLGGHPIGLPNQGHLRAALAQACEDLPEDSPFAATAFTPGFQRYAGRLLDDLRAYGLEAAELRGAVPHAPEELAPKLRDLAQLQEAVAHSMSMLGKRFNRERMEACFEIEGEGELDLDVLVWAGSDDAPLALDWLKWAADQGVRVTILVESHPTNQTLFEGAQNALLRLGSEPASLPRANRLTAQLFAESEFAGSTPELDVQVTVAPDQLAEVEWAIRALLDEVNRGTPASKIAILTRSLPDYAPLIEAAAKRLGLPLRCGRSVPLLSNGFVRFFVDLLRALAARDVRGLLPLLTSSYLRMPRRVVGEIESVIREAHRVRSDEWQALEDAIRTESSAEIALWLLPVLEWRTESRTGAKPLDEWAERIRDLGDQAWLAAALEAKTPTQERDGYAQNAMQRALADAATVERLRGGRARTFERFVHDALRLWEATEVSLPHDPDGVAVVSAAESLGDVEVVWVLGMLEGVFPRRRSENPILFDADMQWMSGHFGVTLPDSHRQAREERDEFYRVACAPRRRLLLSYPQTGEDRDNVPAYYLQEVQRLMAVTEQTYSRQQFVPESPTLPNDVQLAEALSGPRSKPTPLDLASEEAKLAIQRDLEEPFSMRELVYVLQCPFRYAASSRLRVNAPRMTTRWNRLLNLPQVAALASQPDRESASNRLLEELDTMLTDLYSDSTAADLALMRAGGKRLIREWVEREFEARERWPRDEVVGHGVGFDDEHLRSSIKFEDGRTIRFRGEYPAMTVQQGYRVLHVFRQTDPVTRKSDHGVFSEMAPEDQLELGLAMLAIRPARANAALEIDCAATGRRRMIFREGDGHFAPNFGTLVSSRVEPAEQIEVRRNVIQQLEQATQRVAQGRINPTPGDPCRTCEFGELCRRSREFSDIDDPFDFGGGDEA